MRALSVAVSAAALALATTSAAQGEVTRSGASGFELRISFATSAAPARAYAALGEIASWWSSEHTYSGDAANMSLDLAAGGCFCERWEDGSVEHAHVVQALDGSIVRMTGGLGPLQELPVAQVHDWTVEASEDGGARVTYLTRVYGDPEGDLAALAPLVDMVMTEQMGRLEAYLASETP